MRIGRPPPIAPTACGLLCRRSAYEQRGGTMLENNNPLVNQNTNGDRPRHGNAIKHPQILWIRLCKTRVWMPLKLIAPRPQTDCVIFGQSNGGRRGSLQHAQQVVEVIGPDAKAGRHQDFRRHAADGFGFEQFAVGRDQHLVRARRPVVGALFTFRHVGN